MKKTNLVILGFVLLCVLYFLFNFVWSKIEGDKESAYLTALSENLNQGKTSIPVTTLTNFKWTRLCVIDIDSSSPGEMSEDDLKEWIQVKELNSKDVPENLTVKSSTIIPKASYQSVLFFIDDGAISQILKFKIPRVRFKEENHNLRVEPCCKICVGHDAHYTYNPNGSISLKP